jgi:diadenosine tetraphosphate (Ap4A) HIT family hydrolase
MTMTYDTTNIFARILRGEIPNKTIYEDSYALAFHDIAPQAPVHALVIPKGAYIDILDFTRNAGAAEVAGFWQAVAATTAQLGLAENGFRMIANTGAHGGQEVPHFHVHILGGKTIGRMVGE